MGRRAIGIVRVSERKGRGGDSFTSPTIQAERIRGEAERHDLELVELLDEIDVSGGLPLEQRRGMGLAVAEIEAGNAEVLIVAYFDRLVRNIGVQQEIIDRIEAAGGSVLTVDFGRVSHATPSQWMSASQMGLVNDYVRRVARERSGEAQERAVARGVMPWPNVPAGYVRGEDGVLVPDPDTAPAVAEGFRMRAEGQTIREVRASLASAGVERSYHGVRAMLRSRVYLGEIHFGELHNAEAHEPIVDPEVFAAAGRVQVPRGRRAKSDRLLARLGVLRCGTCGSRMVVGTAHHGRYPLYRCPPTGDCPQRVTVSAVKVEEVVVAKVRELLADLEGRASAESHAREAVAFAERAQADLDAAVRAFVGLEGEASARERLAELRAVRDRAVSELEQLGGLSAAERLTAADWDRLTLDERRALIRATIECVTVSPGRGGDRIRVEPFV